ncbi:hypothetical protein XMD530_002261 [Marinobacterium sp. xm-d-530]|nr:hypothetical protein [Marinobacterium sp. xm-d-530]
MNTLKLVLLGLVLWVLVIVFGEFYLSVTYPLTMMKKVNVYGLELGFPILYLSYFFLRDIVKFFSRSKSP